MAANASQTPGTQPRRPTCRGGELRVEGLGGQVRAAVLAHVRERDGAARGDELLADLDEHVAEGLLRGELPVSAVAELPVDPAEQRVRLHRLCVGPHGRRGAREAAIDALGS